MSTKESKEEAHRKILIAVDGSLPSSHAVDYAAKAVQLVPNLHIVLFYVMPSIPPYLEEGSKTDGSKLLRLRKLKEINAAEGKKILEKARNQLIKAQFPPERIEEKMLPRITGLAKDIVNEAEHGLYDALVVGRRGLSGAQEFFMGSVSSQLVQYATNVPLWVIDRQVIEPKLMVAVDGSEASLKAVDHVAFMFGNNPKAEVHFLHVVP
ncbi:MAG: universal stress protein, partial [Deltaproteobacteria bacterium]|nr:universal stress protein [Deltaproteobacteria bacterium]